MEEQKLLQVDQREMGRGKCQRLCIAVKSLYSVQVVSRSM